jgi:hypothetical protein
MARKNARNGGKQPSLTPELQQKLQTASQQHHLSLDTLHDAVCGYLDELRLAGMQREEAFEAVRAFVVRAQERSSAASGPAEMNERLFAQIEAWCEERWRESA